MITYIIEVIKSQGVAVGGIIIIFIILLKFINSAMKSSEKREETLQGIITNHLHDHTSSLALISTNLKESTEQHTKMVELLIKISERVKD